MNLGDYWLRGASAVVLNSRVLGEELADAVKLACRAGVTRLVALSAINSDDDFARQPSRFRGYRNKEAEQLAVESGLKWASLRPSLFASKFAGMWSEQIRAGDGSAASGSPPSSTTPTWLCNPVPSSSPRW